MVSSCHIPDSVSAKVLFIEPFYGGSHKQLIDTLRKHVPQSYLITLSAKKWHWRARCSGFIIHDRIPQITTEKVLFCSSVLNLTELLGLRPDLQPLKKILYFHENQLVYPVQQIKERDVQYAYNQILSCLVADVVLFNSNYNRITFLENIKNIVKLFPDYKPKNLRHEIEHKCQVLYYPVTYPNIKATAAPKCGILHIIWPHRWEFDKGPGDFFKTLRYLKEENVPFRLSVLGEMFKDVPEVFYNAKDEFKNEIVNFGFVENKDDYYGVLMSGHVVVSTAKHEFFGVSLLESTYCGCYPLAPNALVYPEIYPKDCLYSTLEDLQNKLKQFCLNPQLAIDKRNTLTLDFEKYSACNLVPKFLEILN